MTTTTLSTEHLPRSLWRRPGRACQKSGSASAVPAAACGNGTDCSLTVFGAFSGSDRNGLSFTSGLQLSSINQFALSSYFYDATAQVACCLASFQGWSHRFDL